MPIVCINRPNRSSPRLWSLADLKRIARLVYVREGGSEEAAIKVLSQMVIATNYKEQVCEWAEQLKLLREMLSIIARVAGFLGGIAALAGISAYLKRIARQLPKRLGLIALAFAFLLDAIVFLFQKAQDFSKAVDGANDALQVVLDICQAT